MKKLFFLVLILSVLSYVNAGFIIKGISTPGYPYDLKNFTLTLKNGEPVSAGSMWTTDGGGFEKNSVVVIFPDQYSYAIYFPLTFGPNETFDIEVRDFHYYDDQYVLCGSRKTEFGGRAFVAHIDGGLNYMDYVEYTEADRFYSICIPNPIFDYYVAGSSGTYGVVGSVSRTNLQLNNLYRTDNEWVCHKIIATPANSTTPRFIASGRDPACTRVGYCMFSPLFVGNTYVWPQLSEQDALCVVCRHASEGNMVVLSSSYRGSVTLYPVTITAIPTISAYQYSLSIVSSYTRFCVRDIGMNEAIDVPNPAVSVVGYMTHNASSSTYQAWYGVTGITILAPMNHKNYSLGNGQYEHHKIKYLPNGNIYTGGYFQDAFTMRALFGRPRTVADDCDINYHSENPGYYPVYPATLGLSQLLITSREENYSEASTKEMVYYACTPFKGGEDDSEFSLLPPEKESEIATFYDRITVKDTPNGTKYHIYSVTGQLIQTGTTNPDISTAQLSKGMYILRLETGKAFKFIK